LTLTILEKALKNHKPFFLSFILFENRSNRFRSFIISWYLAAKLHSFCLN